MLITRNNGEIANVKPTASMLTVVANNPCMLIRVSKVVNGQRIERTANLDLRTMTDDQLRVLLCKAAGELNRR
jgi:hypothetical protein